MAAKSTASRARGKVAEFRRSAGTRDRALQVAQSLFAERGYRGASLRDIARRIGIKAPSLLHHFSSKRQLYIAVLERMFEHLEDSANALTWSRGSRQQRMREAIGDTIGYIATHPDFVRIMWKEMADESGVGRQVIKRRLPALFSTAANFIFLGQREGEFRPEVDPLQFVLSLNSITLGYFTAAAMVRRLWGMNLLEPQIVDRRKREVIDLVERALFVPYEGMAVE
ncbi:MAG TPA: TetR/AcrR family transcriptional regulator [Candidatus Binataceae bacterium]|nr:TetR/AcrR family transcriptional regulator [Candidatus Binataceae bacterium]